MIFLTGPHGCGKTEASNRFLEQGFLCIDLGPTIRSLHQRTAPEVDLGSWIKRKEETEGELFTDRILSEEVTRLIRCAKQDKSRIRGIVLMGSRSVKGINYLKDNVENLYQTKDLIVYMDVSSKTQRQRWNLREGVQLGASAFTEQVIQPELEMGILGVRDVADKIISNGGAVEALYLKIDEIIHDYSLQNP